MRMDEFILMRFLTEVEVGGDCVLKEVDDEISHQDQEGCALASQFQAGRQHLHQRCGQHETSSQRHEVLEIAPLPVPLDNNCAAENIRGGSGKAQQKAEKNWVHVFSTEYLVPCTEWPTFAMPCREYSFERRSAKREVTILCDLIENSDPVLELGYSQLPAMPNVQHVSVPDDVVLAFQAERAFGAGVGFGRGFEKLIPANGFSTDEMLFQVGVDDSRSFNRARVNGDGPGAAFVFADGEEGNHAEQGVSGTDQAHEAALFQVIAGKEFSGIRLGHLSKLGFDLPANSGSTGIGLRGDFVQLVFADCIFQFFAEFRRLADIKHIQNGFLAEEHEAAESLLVLACHFHFTQRALGFKMRLSALEQFVFFFQFGRAQFLEIFFQALKTLFDLAEVTDHQVEFDILDIAQGIDRANVRDCGVVEGADDVRKLIHVAQMSDVAAFFQSFLADCADVDVFNRGVGELLRIEKCGQAVEAIVWYFGDTDVGFTRVRVGLRRQARFRQNAEERCFAHLGKTDNSGFHKDSAASFQL